MLIDERLLRRDIIIVDDTATGETALAAAGGAAYIVIRFADGRWAVIEPAVLHQKLQVYRMMASPLHDLPAKAFEPHLVGAVHRESTDPRDQAFVENLGERELLILLEGTK